MNINSFSLHKNRMRLVLLFPQLTGNEIEAEWSKLMECRFEPRQSIISPQNKMDNVWLLFWVVIPVTQKNTSNSTTLNPRLDSNKRITPQSQSWCQRERPGIALLLVLGCSFLSLPGMLGDCIQIQKLHKSRGMRVAHSIQCQNPPREWQQHLRTQWEVHIPSVFPNGPWCHHRNEKGQKVWTSHLPLPLVLREADMENCKQGLIERSPPDCRCVPWTSHLTLRILAVGPVKWKLCYLPLRSPRASNELAPRKASGKLCHVTTGVSIAISSIPTHMASGLWSPGCDNAIWFISNKMWYDPTIN